MRGFFFEGWRWRLRPPRPYEPHAGVLKVPTNILSATVQVLAKNDGKETCCFWYGSDTSPLSGEVNAVVVPQQSGRPGNYDVPSWAVAQMSKATLSKGWFNLAQIHSHPGTSVEHSRYDDARTISISVLSIVFPNYGKWQKAWPHGVGVHEFQIDYWHKLSNKQAAGRVAIVAPANAQILDLRSTDARVRGQTS